MKKILVTGSSGYIGSHLCKLLSNQYTIHGLDIVSPVVSIDKFIRVDINNFTGLFEKYDAVIHLAGLVKVNESERKPISYYNTNLIGTLNVLKRIPTNNFIFASTGVAELCNNPYGVSKRAAEDCVKEFCFTEQIPYTIFRFYNVIGSSYGISPTNTDGLMYNLIKAPEVGEFTIFGKDYNTPDGTCVRDYVHVMEICEAIKQAIEEPANSLENLGHGIGKSVEEMVRLFKQVNQVEFKVAYANRRKGDLESSVLKNPSRYMKTLYNFENLLEIKK